MKLSGRNFPGQKQRPSPVTFESDTLTAVLTPWNVSSSTIEKLISLFEENYNEFSAFEDYTRPFPILSALSAPENNARMAFMQINEKWYKEHNQEELKSGFEALFIIKAGSQIILAQVGGPQVYLIRDPFPMQGLSYFPHLFSADAPPLPLQLAGVFEDVSINLHSIGYRDSDQFF